MKIINDEGILRPFGSKIDNGYKLKVNNMIQETTDSKLILEVEKNKDGTIIEFLLGLKSYDGIWFGEKHPRFDGGFWWRPILISYIESIKPKAQ